VIAVTAEADAIVGGMRLVERAAFTLARAGARRLLFVGRRPSATLRLPDVAASWNEGATWLRAAASTVVLTESTTIVDVETVKRLAATDAARPVAAPRPAVLWRADPQDLRGVFESMHVRPPADIAPWNPAADALLLRASDTHERAAAERALYARLGRSGDGWFTRVVDRRFSRALTRLLLPTGISPNQVTIASIAIGSLGGYCFARGTPGAAIAGALLFLLSTIVDGCDGEIARLTFRESAFGARLDILGDNLVHLFLFGGIAVGLYRRSGDPLLAFLGWLLVGGVLLSMATVYLCIIRRPPNAKQRWLFEAFASREFAYLLVVLTVAGRLDWFLWMSAVGTYVFATGLWVLGRRSPA
jgi:phosphatidylglycerophosphate synthase